MLKKLCEKLCAKFSSATDGDAQSALQEEINRFDRIFIGSRGYGFMDWDLETNLVHWHGGFLSHLGYPDGMVPPVVEADEFLNFVHRDDLEKMRANVVGFLKGTIECHSFIVRAKRHDGGIAWVEFRLEAYRGKDDWTQYLSGVVLDVTSQKNTEQALKASEARLVRIIESASDGIWEWSIKHGDRHVPVTPDGGLDWSTQLGSFTFGERCWEMLGYSLDDPLVKEGLGAWRRLMHPDDGAHIDKALMDHAKGKAPFDAVYRIRAKNGDWSWLRARGRMAFDKYGRPQTMSGLNVDVTELKIAEEKVLKAKEEAEKASTAKSQFLSSMSHELRTPLNAILGFTQLFELDTNLTREQRQNIREIKSAGNHLLELVGDVLDLAKIESGSLELNLEPVYPSRVVNECSALLKEPYSRRDLMLEVEFNGLETRAILADAIRLKQVLLNLMGNAGKYNKLGGYVKVETSVDDDQMTIRVEDTGPGIAENLQSQLFQPFNRLGAERSGVEGTGVGLVITKQLVEQMGGDIGFTSEERVGTTFWVSFPLAKASSQPKEIASKDVDEMFEQVEAPELTVNGTKNVLYVEDNPSNQRLMAQVFDRYPELNLHVVGMAVQGLFSARANPPDLIILDVNLPGVNGHEMVKILKQDPTTKHIPVIALSANVLAYDIEKGKTSGFDRYLTKPLDLAKLIQTLNQFLKDD